MTPSEISPIMQAEFRIAKHLRKVLHLDCENEMNQWISVKDKLPEDEALLFHPFKRDDDSKTFIIFVGYLDELNNEWVCGWSGMFPPYANEMYHSCEDNDAQEFIDENFRLKRKEVTHWMRLPEAPKG